MTAIRLLPSYSHSPPWRLSGCFHPILTAHHVIQLSGCFHPILTAYHDSYQAASIPLSQPTMTAIRLLPSYSHSPPWQLSGCFHPILTAHHVIQLSGCFHPILTAHHDSYQAASILFSQPTMTAIKLLPSYSHSPPWQLSGCFHPTLTAHHDSYQAASILFSQPTM